MVEMHQPVRRHEKIKTGSDRAFGLVFAIAFAIIGLWPLIDSGGARIWSLVVAGVFLVISLAVPKVLAPLNKLWTKFGLLLGRVVSPLAMGVVYFLAVVPMGLLMRALGKDLLKLRWNPGADSYWEVRDPPGPPPETMKNQF
jgi:hypothetical protein